MTEDSSRYERMMRDAYRVPFIGSRPRPPRGWPAVVGGCIALWLVLIRISPLAVEARIPGAIALVVTGAVVTVALLLSAFEVAERVHRWLLARPNLGDWRVLVWLGAFAGYLVGCLAVAGLLLAVADA